MFMSNYSFRQPKLKLMRAYETTDSWFQLDRDSMKAEYGVRYVSTLLTAVRRCIDRGGVVSISDSMERDMRYFMSTKN